MPSIADQNQLSAQRFTQLICVGLVLIFSIISKAERLPIKTYTVADGLLRDNVSKIKQDSRGFLWFCTADGVSRFDGYAFTNFTVNEGLPERHVNDFLETKNGAIYIATDAGLARLNPKGLANSKDNPLFSVILPDNPKAKSIQVLFEDQNGTVWTGTSDGLYKLNEKSELETVNLGKLQTGVDVNRINTIIKDLRGALWIGTENSGLFRLLPNGEVEQFTQADGLPDVSISILHEDKNGRIWAGFRQHFVAGLVLLVEAPRKNHPIVEDHYTKKDGLPADWIMDLFESNDGKFWIGTSRGLCEWQGENKTSVCKIYTKANDLCGEEFWSITEDKDKNLWMGTRCGAKKWTRYGFTAYSEADGMGLPLINSIFENRDGELFASFNSGTARTVSRFDGEKFTLVKPNFPPDTSFGWGWKQTVWQDSKDDWWFPMIPGLYRFSHPARFEDLSTSAPQKITIGTKPAEIFRLFEDSRRDIWITTLGTAFELWRWERAKNLWHDLTQEVNFGRYRIGSAFVEDKAGNLWIGTGSDRDDAALIRYRDGQFKVFPQSENQLLAGWIRDLYVDTKGRLWIANSANGVLRLDDVNADKLNFVNYTTAEGLSSIAASCITEDKFGRIYIGTGRGLDRLNPDTGQIENFTTADGLPNSNIEVAYRDRKNDLWFGTTNGLARLIPDPKRKREPPNAFITALHVNGESQSISILGESGIPPLELDSDQRQVTVDFIGLGASLGEKLKYEYRFGESAWIATAERTVNFANLGSGKYQFEVRAQTADRLYSQPSTLSFRIASPLWQRWWFIAGLLALTLFLIYFFYRYRLARFLELERMRTRIATDLHDDIGANLTRISLLSEVAKQKSTNGNDNMLSSIANIARESVASMNDIVWAIGPDHDRLLDLTRRMRQHAEEIFEMRDIELDFNAPADETDLKLSVGVRRDVLLIFKEAVNNAARHSACSKVQIDFRCENSILTLKIKDNGKGFDSENFESDGQGLRSMVRRSKGLGGELIIDSQKDAGTNVEFKLPLPKIRFESRR